MSLKLYGYIIILLRNFIMCFEKCRFQFLWIVFEEIFITFKFVLNSHILVHLSVVELFKKNIRCYYNHKGCRRQHDYENEIHASFTIQFSKFMYCCIYVFYEPRCVLLKKSMGPPHGHALSWINSAVLIQRNTSVGLRYSVDK